MGCTFMLNVGGGVVEGAEIDPNLKLLFSFFSSLFFVFF